MEANRIDNLFRYRKDILSVFFTAGFPKLNDTVEIIKELAKNKVDLIEIGIPFSDPLADGPVIQQSSQQALDNGMTLKLLFKQLKNIRQTVDVPLILMGYFNVVMQFGVENFCKAAYEIGIDGVILPDLPMEEFNGHYRAVFEKYNILNVFLLTPQTSEERIRLIDETGCGFIYMVSSSSTTGKSTGFSENQIAYFERINNLKLTTPRLIGFGISNNENYKAACKYSNGAIIGSAFVKVLSTSENNPETIKNFIQLIRNYNADTSRASVSQNSKS